MKLQASDKQKFWWLIALVAIVTSIFGTFNLYNFLTNREQNKYLSPNFYEQPVTVNAVAAEGELQPKDEVIKLFPPTSTAMNARVERLLVKVGDRVKAGQIIAILDSRARLEAALQTVKARVTVQQANLNKVLAGAPTGDINAHKANIEAIKAEKQGQITAQQATIKRLESELQGENLAQTAMIERLMAELENAKSECARYQKLYQNGTIATQQVEIKCLQQETAIKRLQEAQMNLKRTINSGSQQIAEAKATLKRSIETLQQQQIEATANLEQTAEVRPVNIMLAQAELQRAIAEVKQAQVELENAYVRSPSSSQVIRIHTRPGEIVSNEGIVSLGNTQEMYVKAEVYESDISQVRIGQKVKITSNSLTNTLQGTVEEIGLEIGKKDILSNDPIFDTDARVVEVKIRLNPTGSKQVANLTNLKVKVIINTTK
ncbi:DevB family ABC exporter membrane fusion protein [Calothrix sp. NIES-4071]|nr:DevB family ABC exporter membrane fusion protein [Calothrix sp. NIES-4071]BAZ60050.1 DevB family ABC exporter membrane fusion protein [Calothrix sp. NIES-4105]